jgi:hypothetical protein
MRGPEITGSDSSPIEIQHLSTLIATELGVSGLDGDRFGEVRDVHLLER